MLASVYTFTHSGGLVIRVLNCLDCGGDLDRASIGYGESATCVACGARWAFMDRE